MKKYFLLFSVCIVLINLYGQDFVVSPLITIPGDNRNFSIVSTDTRENYPHDSFICWENHLDSIFTIYLKRIDSLSDPIQVVYSDTNQNINPSIAYYNNGIRIVWQSYRSNHWVLYSREYQDGSFGNIKLLTDTTKDNISPSLDYGSLTCIQEGKLICNLYFSQLEIVDSINCSNPKLLQSPSDPVILYEKGILGNTQIYLAEYIGKPYWRITQISASGYNINPSFGTDFNISYQTLENNKWKIVYSYFPYYYEYDEILKTNNIICNYEHPIVFSYPLPTLKSSGMLNSFSYFDGFFLAYDSDSLLDNKEIFIDYKALYLYGYSKDTIINLSNAPGEDVKPLIAILKPSTAPKVGRLCILWEHTENNKTDIWWAVTTYKFPTVVEEEDINKIDFSLSQNYPNPFNPITKIKFTLPTAPFIPSPYQGEGQRERWVTLKVYDILGNEVTTLVNEEKPAGSYEVEFDGSKLSSGIYFYCLNTVGNKLVRKMSLIK